MAHVSFAIQEDVKEYFKSVFNSIDTDGNGYISFQEFKEFLDTQEHTKFPLKVVKYVYRKYDKNKDQNLDFDEFLEMVEDKDFRSSFEKVTERILKFVVAPTRSQHPHLELRRTITATGMYEKECRCSRSLLGMAFIAIIQIIFYYSNKSYETTDYEGPLTEIFKFHPCKKIQIYRYLSYILVHTDEMHLYGNIVVQILIGIPLELVHGWRVMFIYFFGAIGGCLTHSVFRRTTGLLGASGGVFSFYTAHIAAVIMNWREMSHPAVHLILFGVIVSIDGVYVSFCNQSDKVSYETHIGGAVVGLLLGVLVLKNLKETKKEKIFWHVCCVALGLWMLILFVLDITLPNGIYENEKIKMNCSAFVNN